MLSLPIGANNKHPRQLILSDLQLGVCAARGLVRQGIGRRGEGDGAAAVDEKDVAGLEVHGSPGLVLQRDLACISPPLKLVTRICLTKTSALGPGRASERASEGRPFPFSGWR